MSKVLTEIAARLAAQEAILKIRGILVQTLNPTVREGLAFEIPISEIVDFPDFILADSWRAGVRDVIRWIDTGDLPLRPFSPPPTIPPRKPILEFVAAFGKHLLKQTNPRVIFDCFEATSNGSHPN